MVTLKSSMGALMLLWVEVAMASKLRSWHDSGTNFMDGVTPPAFIGRYASTDGLIYKFGGHHPKDGFTAGFFVFDPSTLTWAELTRVTRGASPSARYRHGFAAAEGRLYVHGGKNASGYPLDELFMFDPSTLTWTELTSFVKGEPPSARYEHGFASLGGKLYLHGGENVTEAALGDIHVFDPSTLTWTELTHKATGKAPPPRCEHGFKPVGNKLYVHAGENSSGLDLADLYVFDPVALNWTELTGVAKGTAPSARRWHGVASVGGKLYVHGGWFRPGGELDESYFGEAAFEAQAGPDWVAGVNFADLFEFDPSTLTWTELTGAARGIAPYPRAEHGFLTSGDRIFLCGGWTLHGAYFTDLFVFDASIKTWTELTGSAQGGGTGSRLGQGVATVGERIYVHGGWRSGLAPGDPGVAMSDLFVFDWPTLTWTELKQANGTPPSGRFFHGFAAAEGLLFVHGGSGPGYAKYADLFVFNPSNQTWTELTSLTSGIPPWPRSSHGFKFADGKLYVHGGTNGLSNYNDLFEFDPSTRAWANLADRTQGTPPPARASHGFEFAGGRLYVFGGSSVPLMPVPPGMPFPIPIIPPTSGYLSDLFVFDPATLTWTDLSEVALGANPSGRFGHCFTEAGGRLYVHGGANMKVGVFGDLFVFDPATLRWTELTGVLQGTAPPVRMFHGLVHAGRRLFVHWGYVPGDIGGKTNFFSFVPIRDVHWLDFGLTPFPLLYDWDMTQIFGTVLLSFQIDLCSSSFSCQLQISGQAPAARIRRTGHGSISCMRTDGCVVLNFESLTVECNMDVAPRALLRIDGSSLTVRRSNFSGCSSESYGSVINCYNSPNFLVVGSDFRNLQSTRQGGAIGTFGCSALIQGSAFTNCTAAEGGGAIRASPPLQCNGDERAGSIKSIASIVGSRFTSCGSLQGGGAVLFTSEGMADAPVMDALVADSNFSACRAEGDGGAIKSAGSLVALQVQRSDFTACRSASSGGAISATNRAGLGLMQTNIRSNSADGIGGGALFLQDAAFSHFGAIFSNNTATAGGGGALLWQGSVYPGPVTCPSGTAPANEPCSVLSSSEYSCSWGTCVPCKAGSSQETGCIAGARAAGSDLCEAHANFASYGPCLASNGKSLDIVGFPDFIFPGLPFSFVSVLTDAYNQTVVSDSNMLLEVVDVIQDTLYTLGGNIFSPLKTGSAVFSISIVPTFVAINYRADSATLQSTPVIQVKERGSTSFYRHSKPISVKFPNGSKVCPAGYFLQLEETRENANGGKGVCTWCRPGTYSLNPLSPRDPSVPNQQPSCLNCPSGGDCPEGGSGIRFRVGSWAVVGGRYILAECPDGFQLVNSTRGTSAGAFAHDLQMCKECPADTYIVDPNTDVCRVCPKGAVCPDDRSCALRSPPLFHCAGEAQIIGTWRLDPATRSYALVDCPAGHSLVPGSPEAGTETLQQCRPCALNQYIVNPRTDQCQGCPQGLICPEDGSCALSNSPAFSCPATGEIVGEWAIDYTTNTYRLRGCPPGFYLDEFVQQCRVCPPAAYCAGGLLPAYSCGSGLYSLSGANSSELCLPSVFVTLTVEMVLLRLKFEENMQQKFGEAIAAIAKVDRGYFVIAGITQALDGRILTVTSNIATANAKAAALAVAQVNLNSVGDELTRRGFSEVSLRSVQVTACPPGYELSDLRSCDLCKAKFFCTGGTTGRQACSPGAYSSPGANSSASCWQASFILVVATLPMSPDNFTDEVQLKYRRALALSAKVDVNRVNLVSVLSARRSAGASLQATFEIAAQDTTAATQGAANLGAAELNQNLQAQGLPQAALSSVTVSTSSATTSPGTVDSDQSSVALITGVSVGAIVVLALAGAASYFVGRFVRRGLAEKAFLKTCRSAQTGDSATASHLPPDLSEAFVADTVVGKGAFGLVVKAKQKGTTTDVAIKVILPSKTCFDEGEVRQLARECRVLEMFTAKKVDHAVHLAGLKPSHVKPDVCWFIMELLDGEDTDALCKLQPFDDRECIKAARSVLAALKVMHADGVVHRDIKPANVIRCRKGGPAPQESDESNFVYKLIDFGSVLGVDETLATKEMMTMTTHREAGMGTQPYMSPEIFIAPQDASYPTDLWSLGVTMFEWATAKLPFNADSDLQWAIVIAGNMDQSAPNLLDVLEEGRRPAFDRNLASVVAKALQKRVPARFASGDEMHEALHRCRIVRGEDFYSVFISYRVASDAALARLLFDELNHSVTPAGHRVTVFWDSHRLEKGEDWEEGFSTALLNSLCIFPVMSYGSTAPLAALEADPAGKSQWERCPLGRPRLEGAESDPEDNVLKEWLITQALLERNGAADRSPSERGMLQLVYPLLTGRQHPPGHPEYPRMGDYFHVQRGGGQFPDRPSPPTSRAVAKFLLERALLPREAVAEIEGRSVERAAQGLLRLQGCKLWGHPPDLAEAELSREQRELVGRCFAGPVVDVGGEVLTAEQRAACDRGLDLRQLQMMKAAVRAALRDFHDVIDRARFLQAQQGRGPAGASDGRDGAKAAFSKVPDTPAPSPREVANHFQQADMCWIKGLSGPASGMYGEVGWMNNP